METKITATELAKSLSDILNRVKYRGEKFVVERNGEPVATLSPVKPEPGMTLHEFVGFLKSIPPVDDNFADDLEEIQASQSIAEMPIWE